MGEPARVEGRRGKRRGEGKGKGEKGRSGMYKGGKGVEMRGERGGEREVREGEKKYGVLF